jgi:hypothetical protein
MFTGGVMSETDLNFCMEQLARCRTDLQDESDPQKRSILERAIREYEQSADRLQQDTASRQGIERN